MTTSLFEIYIEHIKSRRCYHYTAPGAGQRATARLAINDEGPIR